MSQKLRYQFPNLTLLFRIPVTVKNTVENGNPSFPIKISLVRVSRWGNFPCRGNPWKGIFFRESFVYMRVYKLSNSENTILQWSLVGRRRWRSNWTQVSIILQKVFFQLGNNMLSISIFTKLSKVRADTLH